MGRTVTDVALTLGAMTGVDPLDPATAASAGKSYTDHTQFLIKKLTGVRVGIPRKFLAYSSPQVVALFERAIETLKTLGVEIQDPADFQASDEIHGALNKAISILSLDFKVGISKYLSELVDVPTSVRTLSDLVAFNLNHAAIELPPTECCQNIFEMALNASDGPLYQKTLEYLHDITRTRGIDGALTQFNLTALVLPSDTGSYPAAAAGYPVITVPMGFIDCSQNPCPGLKDSVRVNSTVGSWPQGLTFLGTAWSEPELLALAFGYEQASQVREQGPKPLIMPKTALKKTCGPK